jgi:hypothetical protein
VSYPLNVSAIATAPAAVPFYTSAGTYTDTITLAIVSAP